MADARAPGYSSDRNWEPNLLELTLFVSDVDASAEFYRACGISLFDNGQRARHYVDGGIGDCVLQLFPAGEQMISRVQLGCASPASRRSPPGSTLWGCLTRSPARVGSVRWIRMATESTPQRRTHRTGRSAGLELPRSRCRRPVGPRGYGPPMALQNRVTPGGEIIATPARGTIMGNRGILHDENKQIIRTSRNAMWLICRLEFKGRRRPLMSPGTYTELFFLDEAVALAAGHRPCGECRRTQYRSYMAAVNGGVETPLDGPKDLDRRLNESRRAPRTTAPISTLTDGVFIMLGDNEYRLIWNGALHRWTPAGYVDPIPTADAGTEAVVVVTPSLSVAALRHGYPVEVHSSAAPDENATPRDLMNTTVTKLPQSGTVQTNGQELYYEVHGEGPALVLVMGIGYDSSLWTLAQVPALSTLFQVVIRRQPRRRPQRTGQPPVQHRRHGR